MRLAYNFAHRAFRNGFDGFFGVADVEQEIRCIADFPLHFEINIDDVFIAGQHQAFFGDRRLRRLARTDKSPGAEADFSMVDSRYAWGFRCFDRIRQMIVEAGGSGTGIFTKTHDHALFIGLDEIDTGGKPQ